MPAEGRKPREAGKRRGCQRSIAGRELGAGTDAAEGAAASGQGNQIDRVGVNPSESAAMKKQTAKTLLGTRPTWRQVCLRSNQQITKGEVLTFLLNFRLLKCRQALKKKYNFGKN